MGSDNLQLGCDLWRGYRNVQRLLTDAKSIKVAVLMPNPPTERLCVLLGGLVRKFPGSFVVVQTEHDYSCIGKSNHVNSMIPYKSVYYLRCKKLEEGITKSRSCVWFSYPWVYDGNLCCKTNHHSGQR